MRKPLLFLAVVLLLLSQVLTSCSQLAAVKQPSATSPASIILIPGEEDTSARIHMLALNISNPDRKQVEALYQDRIDQVNSQGGFAVMAHPDISSFTITTDELKIFKNYLGMELDFDSHAKWDAVLTDRAASGASFVWGVMTDDSHNQSQCGKRFIMVRTTTPTKDGILAAIRQGSFYWGSAELIKDIAVNGRELSVTLTEEADVQFITAGGKVAKEVHASKTTYTSLSQNDFLSALKHTA